MYKSGQKQYPFCIKDKFQKYPSKILFLTPLTRHTLSVKKVPFSHVFWSSMSTLLPLTGPPGLQLMVGNSIVTMKLLYSYSRVLRGYFDLVWFGQRGAAPALKLIPISKRHLVKRKYQYLNFFLKIRLMFKGFQIFLQN